MRERSNSWKAVQQKKKREARRKLREVRGYNPDAHREKDAERATGRASKKAKEVYRKHARKYGEYVFTSVLCSYTYGQMLVGTLWR